MKETRQIQAYNWILTKIKKREYLPGTALKEELLARELGISATPVREALRRLEREGWVSNVPYCGCFLKEYTKDEIHEVMVIREGIDVAAVNLILKNITPDDFKALDRILTDSYTLVDMYERGKIESEDFIIQSIGLDEKFHSRLIESSRSERLISMSSLWSFQIQSYALQSCKLDSCPSTIVDGRVKFYWVAEQHNAICIAIRLKWEQAAKELVSAHIRISLDSIVMKDDLSSKNRKRKNK